MSLFGNESCAESANTRAIAELAPASSRADELKRKLRQCDTAAPASESEEDKQVWIEGTCKSLMETAKLILP